MPALKIGNRPHRPACGWQNNLSLRRADRLPPLGHTRAPSDVFPRVMSLGPRPVLRTQWAGKRGGKSAFDPRAPKCAASSCTFQPAIVRRRPVRGNAGEIRGTKPAPAARSYHSSAGRTATLDQAVGEAHWVPPDASGSCPSGESRYRWAASQREASNQTESHKADCRHCKSQPKAPRLVSYPPHKIELRYGSQE